MFGIPILFSSWELWFIDFYRRMIDWIDSTRQLFADLQFNDLWILYIIVGLSTLLLIFNITWFYKGESSSFLHKIVLILLSSISILEIFYIVASLETSITYLNTEYISWRTFIINFIIFLIIITNQFFGYYLVIKVLPIEDEDFKILPMSILGWFAVFGLTFLFNWIYLPGNGMAVAFLLLLELNVLIALAKGTKYDGGFMMAVLYFVLYLIWSVSLLLLVIYYFIYLFIALALGLGLMYLYYFLTGQIEFNYKHKSSSKKDNVQCCPICGKPYLNGASTCVCKAYRNTSIPK